MSYPSCLTFVVLILYNYLLLFPLVVSQIILSVQAIGLLTDYCKSGEFPKISVPHQCRLTAGVPSIRAWCLTPTGLRGKEPHGELMPMLPAVP